MLPFNIKYWTQEIRSKNFGDYLTEIIYNKVFVAPIFHPIAYRLIGSVISQDIIARDLSEHPSQDGKIIFWGCGMRNHEPIPDILLERCSFFGVRGPLTRELLNIPHGTAVADPGFIMPLLYKPNTSLRTQGKNVCVPHYSQIADAETLRKACGADLLLSPSVSNEQELYLLIDEICSAEFVLTGSLHAAILACAYGRPFAFWDTGFIDIPFKWHDFAASIGITASFASEMKQGMKAYDMWKGKISIPRILPLLINCPFSVKSSVLLRAACHDDGGQGSISDELLLNLINHERDCINIKDMSEKIFRENATVRAKEKYLKTKFDRVQKSLYQAMREIEHLSAPIEFKPQKDFDKIYFTLGTTGSKYLIEGWTEPQQDYGPWSLRPIARLRIDAQEGWSRAKKIVFHGLFFVPLAETQVATRKVEVWINGGSKIIKYIRNSSGLHTFWSYLEIDIPNFDASDGRDTEIAFLFDDAGTQAALGLNHEDDREVGFAPSYAEAFF